MLREWSRLRLAAGKRAVRRLPVSWRSGEQRRCLLLSTGNVRAIRPRHATGEGRGTTVSTARNGGLGPTETGARTGAEAGTETRPAETGSAKTGCAGSARGAGITVGTGPAVAALAAIGTRRAVSAVRALAIVPTGPAGPARDWPAREGSTRKRVATRRDRRSREPSIPREAGLCHGSWSIRIAGALSPAGPGAPAPCRGLGSRAAPIAMIPLVAAAVPVAGVAALPVPRLRPGSPAPSP